MPTELPQTLLTMLERAPDASLLIDGGGRICFINERGAALTGCTAPQAMGRLIDEVLMLSDALSREPIEGASLPQGASRRVCIMRARDGKEHRVEVHSVALDDERAAVAITVRDLGPAGSYQVTDHFLGILSHALRTPLNAMAGWLYVLKAGSNVPEPMARKALDGIGRAVDQQQRFLDDMRDMAHILTGTLKLELHPTDVRPAIDSAISEFTPQANNKGLSVDQEFGAVASQVMADVARLQQAVRYLLANAVKYTPAGGRIVVAVEESGGHIEVRVSDNGEPIPTTLLPFVFDRFGQGQATATRGDDGFGLPLVKKLIELQGGQVMARSAGATAGAHFVIRLPTVPHSQRLSRRKPMTGNAARE